MDIFFQDFEKRFLSALQHDAPKRRKTDADVINEMAALWFESGGEADGLDDEYVTKIREEVARMEGKA